MALRTNKVPVLQEKSASGAIASFDTILTKPLEECTSLITGYQEGTGTPSPDNVRPLHAFSSASIHACGVNVWNGDYTPNTWIGDTSIGEAVPHTGTSVSDYIPIKPATSYYKFDNGSSRTSYYDKDKNCIGGGIPSGAGIITTPANAYYIRFTITDEKLSGFGLNYPSTDTSYHAYTGNIYTFTFGQSIYQGSIDWLRGVVVGTHAKKVITDITNWEWFGGYKQAYDVNFMVDYPAGSSDVSRLKAENLKPVQPAERIDNINNFIMLVNNGRGIAISVPNGEDIASTAAWIAEHPVTFVYELATPIEIPLGGINLLTQERQNNIFCDTGDIDLTYKDLDIAKRGNFREVFKLPS